MEDLLRKISRVPGVLGACFVGRDGGFTKQADLKEVSKEKVERALKVLSQSLDALGEGSKQKAKSLVINTPAYRLFIHNLADGTLCALCSVATDLGGLRETLISAPQAPAPQKPVPPPPKPPPSPEAKAPAPPPPAKPVPEPKPAPPPPMPVVDEKPLPASILDDIYGICEAELGDLAVTIFENQEEDSKIREGALTRERVLRFCLALQKDAGMIIGPKASKGMADRMLDKLK
jgi:predicted regulator of Ras-like GTPase activity (Roadblock/LC7/MglB family)